MHAHPLELELAERINSCHVCRWREVEADASEGLGVLVLQRDHAVGTWSQGQGEFVFRNIAKWDVVHRAADVAEAYELIVAMAEENRWSA